MKNTCVSHNNPFADIRIWRDKTIGQLIITIISRADKLPFLAELANVSTSNLAYNISNYLCRNFGAFIKSAQSISLSALLY